MKIVYPEKIVFNKWIDGLQLDVLATALGKANIWKRCYVRDAMKASATKSDEITMIESQIFTEVCGSFYEDFNRKKIWRTDCRYIVVQDNQSFAKKGVVRASLNCRRRRGASTCALLPPNLQWRGRYLSGLSAIGA